MIDDVTDADATRRPGPDGSDGSDCGHVGQDYDVLAFGVVKMPKFEGAIERGSDHVTVEGINLLYAEDREGCA